MIEPNGFSPRRFFDPFCVIVFLLWPCMEHISPKPMARRYKRRVPFFVLPSLQLTVLIQLCIALCMVHRTLELSRFSRASLGQALSITGGSNGLSLIANHARSREHDRASFSAPRQNTIFLFTFAPRFCPASYCFFDSPTTHPSPPLLSLLIVFSPLPAPVPDHRQQSSPALPRRPRRFSQQLSDSNKSGLLSAGLKRVSRTPLPINV